jgi:hypothetical protein
MNESRDEESGPAFTVDVTLSGAAIEVLTQLFFFGPIYDGNVVSKSGRDELVDLKLIGRFNGYQFLLLAGVRMALQNGLDRKKDAKRRRENERLAKLDQIEYVLRPEAEQQVQELAINQQPTVENLIEILSRPERADGRV